MQNLEHQEALKRLFASEAISDLVVTGFLEQRDMAQSFHPMLWWLYIRFKSCYVRCQSINQRFLKLDIAAEITKEFDVESDEFCVASIFDTIVFNSHLEHRVAAFECLLDEDCDITQGKIKAGGFVLKNGETLFFDPSSYEGIRVGSKEQVYRWTSLLHYPMANYKEEKWEFG